MGKNRFSIDEYMAMRSKENKHAPRHCRDIEHQTQCSCVKWFNMQHPGLRGRLFAVPNGGKRDKITEARIKEEGAVNGVSDLILLRRNSKYGALLIEMKTKEGRQRKSQKQWEENVTRDGEYKYVICRSVVDFINEINKYLKE